MVPRLLGYVSSIIIVELALMESPDSLTGRKAVLIKFNFIDISYSMNLFKFRNYESKEIDKVNSEFFLEWLIMMIIVININFELWHGIKSVDQNAKVG